MKKITLEEHFSTFELSQIRNEWVARMGMPLPVNSDRGMQLGRLLGDFENYRLPEMDKYDIEIQVVGTSSPSVQGIISTADAVAMAREVNDILADNINKHPDRFAGFATLPMQDGEAAAKELERCVKEYNFRGALIHGHTNYEYLDARKNWVMWEAAEALDVPIYLHPTESDPTQLKLYEGYPELLGAVWSWGVETAGHALRIMCSGIFDQFPKTQLILGHLGENIPYGLWRMQNQWEQSLRGSSMHTEASRIRLKKTPTEYMRENVMLTTSGNYSPEALRCAIDVMGIDRIMFSVDYPFEETAPAVEFIESAALTDEEREKICYSNAKKLLKL
ncbi:MAG: amidohydrolase family protein [Oscillospiraceae bacterium]|nr:amidohydrolase family protein [Oscillospiraceae bacterium]